jgi:hypothetical protein
LRSPFAGHPPVALGHGAGNPDEVAQRHQGREGRGHAAVAATGAESTRLVGVVF